MRSSRALAANLVWIIRVLAKNTMYSDMYIYIYIDMYIYTHIYIYIYICKYEMR